MFLSSIQPGVVSLFSSTGSEVLGLFSTHVDPALPADSVIHLVHDATSQPPPPPPAILIDSSLSENEAVDERSSRAGSKLYSLDQTVLHIQSPTLKTTYIRAPPEAAGSKRRNDLGLRHPWLHLQVRNLGKPWSFEVGLVDTSGRLGVMRCSTFQVHTPTFLPS